MSTMEETRKVPPAAAAADRPADSAVLPHPPRPRPATGIWDRLVQDLIIEISALIPSAGPAHPYYTDPFRLPPWVINPPRQWPIRWEKPQPVPWTPALDWYAARHPALYDVRYPHGPLFAAPAPSTALFAALLARSVIGRVAAVVEIGAGLAETGEQESSRLGGGYLSRFIDDWCGTGRPRFKIPRPRPPWLDEELSFDDLLVIGAEFSTAAAAADGALGLLLDKAVLDLRQALNAQF